MTMLTLPSFETLDMQPEGLRKDELIHMYEEKELQWLGWRFPRGSDISKKFYIKWILRGT